MTPALTLAHQRDRGLMLRNPLIAGPGTIGYGREYGRLLPLERLAAVITNTTTLHARPGNPQPRLAETPAGMILATGLQNPGLRTVLQRHARLWERLPVPVILSLAAEDEQSFAQCIELAQHTGAVAAFELEPDLLTTDVDMVGVVDALRGISGVPLLVHLPVAPPQALADAIVDLEAVGCDGVIVGSPWPGLVTAQAASQQLLAGGVCGPAIRPLALRLVHDVVQLLGTEHVPLLAAGGISSAADVASFLAVGASAVILDTVIYVQPAAVSAMVDAVEGC